MLAPRRAGLHRLSRRSRRAAASHRLHFARATRPKRSHKDGEWPVGSAGSTVGPQPFYGRHLIPFHSPAAALRMVHNAFNARPLASLSFRVSPKKKSQKAIAFSPMRILPRRD